MAFGSNTLAWVASIWLFPSETMLGITLAICKPKPRGYDLRTEMGQEHTYRFVGSFIHVRAQVEAWTVFLQEFVSHKATFA